MIELMILLGILWCIGGWWAWTGSVADGALNFWRTQTAVVCFVMAGPAVWGWTVIYNLFRSE